MEIGNLLSAVLLAGAAIYAASLVRIWIGLLRLAPGDADGQPSATVLVAARNEEKAIGACLESLVAQDYRGEFDVLVLDDGSTDNTAGIVEQFAGSDHRVRLLRIQPSTDGTAPKKHALRCGLEASESDLVFVTDADCIVPPGWMSTLARHFDKDVGLVTGMVLLPQEKGVLARIRELDFLSYSFCSAGAMRSGWPLLATAMNLAYRRRAFEEAGGFGRDAHVMSGDDDLLLHGIIRRTNWRAAYAFGEDSIVESKPVVELGAFMNQRMRWASKATRYPPLMTLFLVGAFILYLGLLFGLPLWAAGIWTSNVVPFAVGVKLVADALVLGTGCLRFGRTNLMKVFLVAEVLHLPYILVAAVGGTLGFFRWKGRRATAHIQSGPTAKSA